MGLPIGIDAFDNDVQTKLRVSASLGAKVDSFGQSMNAAHNYAERLEKRIAELERKNEDLETRMTAAEANAVVSSAVALRSIADDLDAKAEAMKSPAAATGKKKT